MPSTIGCRNSRPMASRWPSGDGPDRQPLAAWGGRGTEAGQFYDPTGVALGPDGRVYVADALNHRIQVLSPSGEPLAVWGGPGVGAGQFRFPRSVAVDASGAVYV